LRDLISSFSFGLRLKLINHFWYLIYCHFQKSCYEDYFCSFSNLFSCFLLNFCLCLYLNVNLFICDAKLAKNVKLSNECYRRSCRCSKFQSHSPLNLRSHLHFHQNTLLHLGPTSLTHQSL